MDQRFLDAIFHLSSVLFYFHGAMFLHNSSGFLTGSFFTLLGVDLLKHLSYELHLGARSRRECIAVEVDGTPLVLGVRKHLAYGFQHT